MPPSSDSQFDHVWVGRRDPLPDVCCTCGMFTDHRVSVKHTTMVQKAGEKNGSGILQVLMILIFLFTGPLGWIISILMNRANSDTEATKTVKEKTKLKISQCSLCHGTAPPEVHEAHPNARRLKFFVHPHFKSRFLEAKKAAELENQ